MSSSMTILLKSVTFPRYKTCPMKVDPLWKVAQVKANIFKERNIPIELQRLTFMGTILQDRKTLEQYQIEEFVTVNMFQRFKDEIQIYIKCPNGSTLSIETHNSVTVQSLISSIFIHDNNHRSLGPTGVSLYVDGKRLAEGLKISQYKVEDGSTLYLNCPCDFSHIVPYDNSGIDFSADCSEIYIKFMKSKTITFEYNSKLTVMDIKNEIAQKENIPPFLQCLSFKGTRLESDSSPLITYSIKAGSVLLLELQPTTILIQCEIWMGGKQSELKNLYLEVGLNDKINDLKERIQVLKGFAPEKQRVFYNETLLASDRTFYDYHVHTGDCLRLHLDRDVEIPVFVKNTIGEIFPFELNPSDTVAELKLKLMYLSDIPLKKLCVYINDKFLEDSKKLSECGVKNGTTLVMFLRV